MKIKQASALIFVFSVFFFCSNCFSSQLFFDYSLGVLPRYHFHNEEFRAIDDNNKFAIPQSANSLGMQFLFSAPKFDEAGIGFQYSFDRRLYSNGKNLNTFCFLPIYFTVRKYPFQNFTNLFFRVDLGGSIIFFHNVYVDTITPFGSLYCGAGLGVNLPNWGLVFTLMYRDAVINHKSSSGRDYIDVYDEITITVGYKL
ncbi:MAG: hypothetical protein LBH29_00670 [Elusimicrobiota bacterium]|jgi:hypothetical protein|nr:hypothetical protein [Elusimicrobiota bacterium]